jgi:hypothetical protein
MSRIRRAFGFFIARLEATDDPLICNLRKWHHAMCPASALEMAKTPFGWATDARGGPCERDDDWLCILRPRGE